ncbi:MAG: hypothetical protein WBO44_14300 [Saprospiraceae bacterium]|jgi:regulator of protease activity HflC (stomatin/prohibitin superfamily)
MATINIDELMTDMLSAIKSTVSNHWKEIKDSMQQFLIARKARFELLAELRISGELSQEHFESRLEDEKQIAEAEMQALEVISKAMAQKAANAAIDIFQKAVGAAIKTVL